MDLEWCRAPNEPGGVGLSPLGHIEAAARLALIVFDFVLDLNLGLSIIDISDVEEEYYGEAPTASIPPGVTMPYKAVAGWLIAGCIVVLCMELLVYARTTGLVGDRADLPSTRWVATCVFMAGVLIEDMVSAMTFYVIPNLAILTDPTVVVNAVDPLGINDGGGGFGIQLNILLTVIKFLVLGTFFPFVAYANPPDGPAQHAEKCTPDTVRRRHQLCTDPYHDTNGLAAIMLIPFTTVFFCTDESEGGTKLFACFFVVETGAVIVTILIKIIWQLKHVYFCTGDTAYWSVSHLQPTPWLAPM